MGNSKGKKGDGDDALLAALRSCGPVAKGSLSSVCLIESLRAEADAD